MNVFNSLKNFKKHIYNSKINKLFENYDFYDSITKKCDILFDDYTITKIVHKNTTFNNTNNNLISQNIIKSFIESSLLNILSNKKTKYSEQTANFIMSNNIHKTFLNNIDIFKEDIKILNRYNTLINKLEKIK